MLQKPASWLVLLVLVLLGFLGQLLAPDDAVEGGSDPSCDAKFAAGRPQIDEDNTTFLCRNQYAVLHDDDRKVPLYSAERLVGRDLERDVERTDDFRPDPELSEAERADLEDYRRSGFDRGHLTPAADADTLEEMSESFLLSNIVPQNGPMNSGIWAGLESATRACAQRLGNVYVITGPVFEGRTRTIGEGVAVPGALYKIIVNPDDGAARAFLMPNRSLPRSAGFTRYEVTVEELQDRTGFTFFPGGGVDVTRRGNFCADTFGR